ncbi:MAG: hypothetical protein F4Z31_10410 [Gemmatimonadetes bacterium]|nr:hypothetical protein [Gemmatimonadota bacterium]MYJ12518.1 hypothetical protein [Gemmatimonadota bacterium]
MKGDVAGGGFVAGDGDIKPVKCVKEPQNVGQFMGKRPYIAMTSAGVRIRVDINPDDSGGRRKTPGQSGSI